MKILRIALLFALIAVGVQAQDDVIRTETDSTIITDGKMDTRVESPPPSAISPNLNISNSDLCTVGVAGAVQSQILGISGGTAFTEENCKRLKNAKTLYDMGMKVAAVSVMCQDPNVFDAMLNAGTPCPKDGLIGDAAKAAWQDDLENNPKNQKRGLLNANEGTTGLGAVLGVLALLLLL